MAEEKSEQQSELYYPKAPLTDPSALLVRYRFWNDKGKKKFGKLDDIELDKAIREVIEGKSLVDGKKDNIENYADEHHVEIANDQMFKSGYPEPKKAYTLVYESYQKPIESFYFWSLNHFKDLGFPLFDKVTDVFAASEQSAFYGAAMQRLGLHEDKVSQYLATIGRMVKELFQIVREIRIIKERLELYRGSMHKEERIRQHNEIALKGLFVDMVEGGAKNPGSVFGMASNLQFTALPDLFFGTHPASRDNITDIVNDLPVNDKLKEVLKRKLAAYMTWKAATFHEMKDRESHTIRYLRQHYDAIQLYMTWIKPYLKHVKRLQQETGAHESADIIGAFEGSTIEIEVIAKNMPKGNDAVFACILFTLKYRTSPTMSYSREGRHQGPLHMGRVTMDWRTYAWTQDDINRYKEMREAETFQMLSDVDGSIRDAMAGLGEDLRKYIEEAKYTVSQREEREEAESKRQEKELKRKKLEGKRTLAEEFGFKQLKEQIEEVFKGDKKTKEKAKSKKEEKEAFKAASGVCWLHYRNFKKANKLITW